MLAAQTLESAYRTNGQMVQSAFEPVRSALQTGSAVIQREKIVERRTRKISIPDDIAYGTVISEDGFILTKASEIGDGIGLVVLVDKKSYKDVAMVAVDPAWDVALLKIPATGLAPVKLAVDLPEPERGTWVVANGASSRSKRMPQVGIISASAREVLPAGGAVLGVGLKDEEGKLVVEEVHEKSGAEAAGIRKGDVIVAVGGQKIADRKQLGEAVEKHRVGDDLDLTIQRDGAEISMKVRLAGRVDVFGEEESRNDMMSGSYSARRSGFPRIIQHDIVANRAGMGGPVLDLDGRCLGMNIARANRCETFAIPAGDLRSLADRLITQATAK
jgi:S1-C subfamily serine protease